MDSDQVTYPIKNENAFISLDEASKSARQALQKGYDRFYTDRSSMPASIKIKGGQES